jgi:enoyl-CoA hydratase/carnithine racemase
MAVLYEKRERIAYIILNRPEVMNALNRETWGELHRIWSDFNQDDEVWVAIITGTGDKAFSAGMDIKELSRGIGDDPKESFWDPVRAMARLPFDFDVRKPIIAAVNGRCNGVALDLILECDIRIASENATFAMPEVKLGISVRGVAPLLARAMPLSITMEMLLTGEHISAQEAYRGGLVSRLVPPAELMPTAERIAGTICENAPLAVRATKEAVLKGLDLPFEHANRLAVSLNYAVLNSEDSKEGILAAKEKRKPIYKGT